MGIRCFASLRLPPIQGTKGWGFQFLQSRIQPLLLFSKSLRDLQGFDAVGVVAVFKFDDQSRGNQIINIPADLRWRQPQSDR